MSVSDEFRTLLLHAAERLDEEDGPIRSALSRAVKDAEGINRYDWNVAVARLNSYVAATTYAQLVMEMTAKFLTDEKDRTGEESGSDGG